MYWKIPLSMDREYAELQWVKKQRDQLREALETATNIIDKMGDMPDMKICPIVWRDLECEGAVDKARAALKATEEW